MMPEDNEPATAEVIAAGAAVQAAKLTRVAEALVATAQESIYQSTRSKLLRGLVVFFIATSLVGNALALTLATQNRGTLKTATEGTARVKDCTTPEGKCYQRSQAQTATAVGSINTVTQIAVVCADQYDGRPAIEACIHTRLRAVGLEK
jgi:hypothetical protein